MTLAEKKRLQWQQEIGKWKYNQRIKNLNDILNS